MNLGVKLFTYILFISLVGIVSPGVFAGEIDSVIYHRLKKVENNISLYLTYDIQEVIREKMYTNRTESELVLSRSIDALPAIEKMLWEHHLPTELKYLPAALSEYDVHNVTEDGGVGMWKLNYITAKRYGLRINDRIDERKDFIKSTAAALRYLKDLDNIYHNWNLNILAYLSSPAEVNSAIARSGSNANFMLIYGAIGKGYKLSYAHFIASTYLLNFYDAYELKKRPLPSKVVLQPVVAQNPIKLSDMAALLSVPVAELKRYNPTLLADIYDPQLDGNLYLPKSLTTTFYTMQDSLYQRFLQKDKIKKAHTETVAGNSQSQTEHDKITIKVNEVKFYHKVEKGESLYKISKKYNLHIDDIRRWNNLPRETIFYGQSLVLYKSQPTVIREIEQPAPPKKGDQSTLHYNTTQSKTTWITYKVKSGDSLWKIMQKFGVSEAELKQHNKIKGTKIFPGQILKIKKR